jgi:hypothetical protein
MLDELILAMENETLVRFCIIIPAFYAGFLWRPLYEDWKKRRRGKAHEQK